MGMSIIIGELSRHQPQRTNINICMDQPTNVNKTLKLLVCLSYNGELLKIIMGQPISLNHRGLNYNCEPRHSQLDKFIFIIIITQVHNYNGQLSIYSF